MSNPLLTAGELPSFSAIKPEHIQPALEQAIQAGRDAIEQVAALEQPTWDTLSLPLEDASDKLDRVWSPISHMNAVVSSDELRAAHDACLPMLSEYSTWVGQHKGLYQAYLKLKDSAEYDQLSPSQQKVIKDSLRDFELSGIGLEADKQQRYGQISMRLSELASTFSNNVMDATLGWHKQVTDEAELAGLPESAKMAAQEAAKARELDGYVFTLEFPSYYPVLTYADNRELRREVYEAFVTRASDQGPNAGKWDNAELIIETLGLRREAAELLGFGNYAERSLATKMAESTEQVVGFLDNLAERSFEQGKSELAEVAAFAKREAGLEQLESWDVGYFSEKLKQEKYSISVEELRPYFPEDKVLTGLFEVVARLFKVRVEESKGVDTWHDDVRFFRIFDADGELRGSFYLDLYARAHKRGGAWMADLVGRRRHGDGSLQNPVAFLTCNFNGPVGGKPALFTHDEVITLFHEFGHGLHHMLTQIEEVDVAGINGVPWDAVELPSQFLENWCWQPEALAFISGHYETGEPLPREMLDKMLAAKNYNSAMAMLRQLEFALFDFKLHLAEPAKDRDQVQAQLDNVREKVTVTPVSAFSRFQNSFSHIFAGGYAAGYYSYKWAEVLSADAFSRFEEEGIFNPQTGQDFLHCILEKGGSDEPMNLFDNYRGRKPRYDALLRHRGLMAA